MTAAARRSSAATFTAVPWSQLQGKYFYTDFVGTSATAQIWSLDFDRNTNPAAFNGNNGTNTDISATWQSLVYDPTVPAYMPDSTTGSSAGLDHIVSFGEDNAGNMYLVDFGNGSGFDGQYPGAGMGEIFRIVPNLGITVTVERSTGEMTFSNETGQVTDIRSYSITSSAGAINSAVLTPITGRLDAPPNGDGSIDPNHAWHITSTAGSKTSFGEAANSGSASLGIDEEFQLSGDGGWIQSIYEDFNLSVTLGDGSTVAATINFVGNNGLAFTAQRSQFQWRS